MKTLFVKNISKQFYNKKALDNITMTFSTGNIYSLLGENGAGKSTLASILSGRFQATSGELLLNEKVFNLGFSNTLQAIQNSIYLVEQHPLIDKDITVFEHCKIAYPSKISNKALCLLINNLITKYSLPIAITKYGKELLLSQVFYCKLLIALIQKPSFLILDEPTVFLDINERKNLYSLLTDYTNNGEHCVIIITHNKEEIISITNTNYYFTKGKLSTEKILDIVHNKPISFPSVKAKPLLTYSSISSKNNSLFPITDISFSVLTNQINLIIGSQESGIETLEEIISGFQENYFLGKILDSENKDITKKYSIKYLRNNNIGIVSSNKVYRSSNPNLTIKEFLYPLSDNQINIIINKANIKCNPIDKLLTLSGGMLQRLIIQRELFFTKNILFLFNVDQGLDSESLKELSKLLLNSINNNFTILIFSTTNSNELNLIATNKYFMEKGHLYHE